MSENGGYPETTVAEGKMMIDHDYPSIFRQAHLFSSPHPCAACFIHVPPGDFTRKEQLCEMLEEDPDFEASVLLDSLCMFVFILGVSERENHTRLVFIGILMIYDDKTWDFGVQYFQANQFLFGKLEHYPLVI